MKVQITVNGEETSSDVEPRLLLAHYLRDVVGLKATNIGCDTTSCGACTVLLDGESVKSCTLLAVQAEAQAVTTMEGLSADGDHLHPVAEAFPRRARSAVRVLHARHGDGHGQPCWRRTPKPTEREIREGLEGNLCRCTGLPQHRPLGDRRVGSGPGHGPGPERARRHRPVGRRRGRSGLLHVEVTHDPRRLRLSAPRLRSTARSRCSPSTATTRRSSPAGTRCCR